MTIDDIAKELKVSKSTVSRALSGKGRIGEETRQKIKNFAQEKGFIYRQKPKTTLGKTRNIGVVIPTDAYTTNIPFFQECLLGISESASVFQYHVVIATGAFDDISGVHSLVENKKADAIILMRNLQDDKILKYLTDLHFPTGLVGRCEYDEVLQVDSDNRGAAESLTSMLITKGYRKFAMIANNMTFRVDKERCNGFYTALAKHGLPKEEQLVYTNFGNVELIDGVINDIIREKVECIICADDVLCTRIMSRMQVEGYRIPMDIAIASLCNSANLNCFSPSVTAVNLSVKQMGNAIGNQMINYLMGNEYSKKSIVDYEILFRKSTDILYRE